MAPFPDATVLAFDFGTRRIGVAIGNTIVGAAHPLVTIEGDSLATTLAAIGVLVDEWRPQRLLVGMPVHADGTPHDMTAKAQRFGRQLAGRFGLPVDYADERHTTYEASSTLAEAGLRGKGAKDVRDRVAAQLILQGWLDDQPR